MRLFIEKKTRGAGPSDLIIVVGDLNVNANKMTPESKERLAAKVALDPDYKVFETYDSLAEYKQMLKLIAGETFTI